MKYLTHPLTVCNLIIVGSLVFIETMHVNYHRGLTTCEESVIIQELDATLGVTE